MSVTPKSRKPGKSTSAVEVTNISKHGLWLLVDDREHFLAFQEFPWFQNATVAEIHGVTRPSSNRLRWEKLDVDLAVDSISDPDRYPLIARDRPVVPRRKTPTPKTPRSTSKGRNPSKR